MAAIMAKPLVTQLALIGRANFAVRDGLWRDMYFSARNPVATAPPQPVKGTFK